SNPRPSHCERDALPTAPEPHRRHDDPDRLAPPPARRGTGRAVLTRITGPRSPVGVAGLLEIIEQLVEQFEPLGTAAGDVGGLQEGGQGRIAVPAGPGAHGSAGALKDVKAC